MKLGLISDVHGDPVALEKAWGHLTRMGADRVVCAGDLVGYGPSPDPVVAFFAEHRIVSVRGNHDRWALERGPGGIDEFGGGTPGPEALAYLGRLPFDLVVADGPRVVVVVHGSPRSDMEFVTRRTHPPAVLRGDLRELNADVLVTGHTHEPMWYRCDRGLVVNPGSLVSSPAVQSSRTFALLDLEALGVAFHDVETGREVEVGPWLTEGEDPPPARGPRPAADRSPPRHV
jgi:putative phosphoesterase